MPKFVVTLQRTTICTTEVEITAADEDAACTKAIEQAEKGEGPKLDWDLDDEEFDVNSCDEA